MNDTRREAELIELTDVLFAQREPVCREVEALARLCVRARASGTPCHNHEENFRRALLRLAFVDSTQNEAIAAFFAPAAQEQETAQ
jgi:hypothetical protein